MDTSFLILFSWYLIIPISLIGFGLLAQKIFYREVVVDNFGYAGLFGISFFVIYSYLSNFFIPHSKTHNLILVITGLFIFIFFFIQSKKEKFKKQTVFLLINLLILFVGILIFKNHDDFIYYHFPYTYLLTQNDLIIGLGNLGHGFRTQSSMFYLNSLFYLPYVDYYLFNLGAILILCFSNLILLKKILFDTNFYNKKLDDRFYRYLSLFFFVFINIFFYRISEHGTDRSAQILVLVLFVEVIYLINMDKIFNKDIIIIYLILGLIISLKAFYILYFLVLIPISIHLFKIKKKLSKIIYYFSSQYFLIIFVLITLSVLMTNLLNTGCFIYPVHFTCLENLSWSIPVEEVKKMNNWYELWSKAGAGPNFRIENPEEYIQYFSWFENWFQIYFFNKVSDFLIGLLILSLVFFAVFFNKNIANKKNFKIKNLKFIFFILIILFFEWIYNHPALRYGGYSLVVVFFGILISKFLTSRKLKLKEFLIKAKIIIIITFIIFNTRNLIRINDEAKKYSFNPLKYSFYDTNKKNFRIEKKINLILKKNEFCSEKLNKKKCLDGVNKVSRNYNKIVIENSND